MQITMTLSLPRQPSSVTHARRVLTTLLGLTDVDEDVRGHLAVLISEACANAVTHSDPDSTVDVAIVIDGSDCEIEVGNRGTVPDSARFDGGLPDPLTVGGRGLPFISALADSVAFVAGPPGRVLLRMRLRLTSERTASS